MSSELILTLALPLLASIAIALIESKIVHAISMVALGITLALNTHLLISSLKGATYVSGPLIGDPIGLLMCELILIVCLICVCYSYQHLRAGVDRRSRLFLVLMLALTSTLIGLALSSNILGILLFLETSTAVSAILILYGERRRKAVLAASIYLAISIVESLFIIAGIYYLTKTTGLELAAMNLSNIRNAYLSGSEASTAAFLILFGLGTKIGLVPLGLIWLPIAFSEAPSPVSAVLAGVMDEAVFIATLRCAYALLPHASKTVVGLLAVLGMASIWIGILGMVLDRDLKRMLAFSSILSMGSICMVAGLSFTLSADGIALGLQGALYYLTVHSIGKSLLFLASGSYLQKIGERNWIKMTGATKVLPLTSILWVIGAISIAGLFPPAAGYYAKHLMISSIDQLENTVFGIPPLIYKLSLYAGGIALFFILIGFTVLSLRGTGKSDEVPMLMLISKIALALICIILGLASSNFEHKLLEVVVDEILRLGGG
ncbi:MAG: hypothetical protein DRJ26_04990 [Candidatus Methanomethylicota archaeon]|uniref:NADH:quinone oxidoreductase/Mrp antiporter transmembrane domain-containing protein n=1 Tax=Thermoproteota archaeon TaxID=2056631 RepID=A0A497EYA3_9CREN|nr:MAG: hypothetical protein DRJ26_04990 [Candidatus Verstraetearchaeota archaeon]